MYSLAWSLHGTTHPNPQVPINHRSSFQLGKLGIVSLLVTQNPLNPATGAVGHCERTAPVLIGKHVICRRPPELGKVNQELLFFFFLVGGFPRMVIEEGERERERMPRGRFFIKGILRSCTPARLPSSHASRSWQSPRLSASWRRHREWYNNIIPKRRENNKTRKRTDGGLKKKSSPKPWKSRRQLAMLPYKHYHRVPLVRLWVLAVGPLHVGLPHGTVLAGGRVH